MHINQNSQRLRVFAVDAQLSPAMSFAYTCPYIYAKLHLTCRGVFAHAESFPARLVVIYWRHWSNVATTPIFAIRTLRACFAPSLWRGVVVCLLCVYLVSVICLYFGLLCVLFSIECAKRVLTTQHRQTTKFWLFWKSCAIYRKHCVLCGCEVGLHL